MFSTIFHEVFFRPLYNALVVISNLLPSNDVGFAIITLTVLVQILLLPLYVKQTKTQLVLKRLDPELKAIRDKYKDNPQEQARQTLEVYKKYGINPFSSIFILFLQLPILFALFFVFRESSQVINPEYVYSFVSVPETLHTMFLGLVDLTARNIPLAVLVGFTQYLQVKFSLPPLPEKKEAAEATFADDLARSMHLNAKYVFPVLFTVFALAVPAALALYWFVTNLFAIARELVIRRRVEKIFEAAS